MLAWDLGKRRGAEAKRCHGSVIQRRLGWAPDGGPRRWPATRPCLGEPWDQSGSRGSTSTAGGGHRRAAATVNGGAQSRWSSGTRAGTRPSQISRRARSTVPPKALQRQPMNSGRSRDGATSSTVETGADHRWELATGGTRPNRSYGEKGGSPQRLTVAVG